MQHHFAGCGGEYRAGFGFRGNEVSMRHGSAETERDSERKQTPHVRELDGGVDHVVLAVGDVVEQLVELDGADEAAYAKVQVAAEHRDEVARVGTRVAGLRTKLQGQFAAVSGDDNRAQALLKVLDRFTFCVPDDQVDSVQLAGVGRVDEEADDDAVLTVTDLFGLMRQGRSCPAGRR